MTTFTVSVRTLTRPGPLTGRLSGWPAAACAAELLLLAALTAVPGLGAPGWLTGVGLLGAVVLALRHGLRRHGRRRLGPANAVTLARAVLVAGVAALAVDGWATAGGAPSPTAIWAAVALTGPALLLDAVDGWVARRSGSASALGARFDGELDAVLILVLSVLLVVPVGGWVLVIGLMRYGFAAAALLLRWPAGSLPPRYSRKVVAAVQGVVLWAVLPGLLPTAVTVPVLTAALLALCWSFGLDVRWLHRRRQRADGLHSRAPSANHGTGTLG